MLAHASHLSTREAETGGFQVGQTYLRSYLRRLVVGRSSHVSVCVSDSFSKLCLWSGAPTR